MKQQLLTMTLMLLMGAGVVSAQDCCQKSEQKAENEQKACCQQGSRAVIENILTRTSVRKFKQQPVENEKIETMLRAAMAAPSAMNKQPWHFVVIDDKAVLDSLAGPARRGDMVRQAPLAIVICGDYTKTIEGQGREFWIQDASAAAENLLLAAHALRLGAVWTSAWPNEQKCQHIRQVLQLPDTMQPLNITLVGYPDEQPTPKDKWKPKNISYNRYNQQ